MTLSIWHWLAGLLVLILLVKTKGSVRGGILVLLLTFAVARVAYVIVTQGQLP